MSVISDGNKVSGKPAGALCAGESGRWGTILVSFFITHLIKDKGKL